ncbi:AGE family epimerase/isomerase [Roseobacter cerasinus]|uniref:AGE family epimerase/isomerase n=1 Tax=Roseobacter cerasinus TaxID=2602289 RepID=UPI001357E96F
MNQTEHGAWLLAEAVRQLDFDGLPVASGPQELHTATRLVHSYALAQAIGHPASHDMLDRGLSYIVKNYPMQAGS